MNKKLKEGIKMAFEPPEPKRKTEFLSSFNYPRVGRFGFLTAQAGYIRKRVWVISFLLAAVVVFGLMFRENTNAFAWNISTVLPLVALFGITEIARSISYNMAELEMSCKYSFIYVVLARLLILGIVNAIVFVFISILFVRASNVGALVFIARLFTPYLLACSLSLFALNRFRTKEGLYICGCATVLAGVLSLILFNPGSPVLLENNWLIFAFYILLAWVAAEVVKLIRKTEENQWNLSLTA